MPPFVRRALDRLPPSVRGVVDLVIATGRGAAQDRVTGLAAEIAFWVILSLPPLLVAAAAAAGLVGDAIGQDVRLQLVQRFEQLSGQVFSASTVEDTIAPTLDALLTDAATPLLSISFLITVISGSRAFWVVVHAITIAYDLSEVRPSWVSRLLGIAFTVAGILVGIVLFPLILAGPQLGEIIEEQTGVTLLLGQAWRLAYWPVSLVVVTVLIASLYHFATPWETPLWRDLPGAALATVLGLAATVGLRYYTAFVFDGATVYAPLAAPLAVLVFLWLQGLALLVGAELNAEIEKASPTIRERDDTRVPLEDVGRRARLLRLARGRFRRRSARVRQR